MVLNYIQFHLHFPVLRNIRDIYKCSQNLLDKSDHVKKNKYLLNLRIKLNRQKQDLIIQNYDAYIKKQQYFLIEKIVFW